MPPWTIPTTISKAWACLRTNTFVHRSDDRTTNAHADLTAPRRCIVVWPPHLVSQLTRAQQSRRPRRLMEVSSICPVRDCFVAASGLRRLPNRGVRELPPTCRGYAHRSAAGAEGILPV